MKSEIFPAAGRLTVHAGDNCIVMTQDGDPLGAEPAVVYIPLVALSATIKAMREAAKEPPHVG